MNVGKDKLFKETKDNPKISFTFEYIMKRCHSWDDFCQDAGLNPFFLNEGLGQSSDNFFETISFFKKHGVY